MRVNLRDNDGGAMRPADRFTAGAPTRSPAGRARPGALWRAAPVLLALAVLAWVALGPGASAAWDAVRANLDAWQQWAGGNLLVAVLVFFLAYALATALPLPALTVMSLLAGALFGRHLGTAVASVAYTAGVTAAFLAARCLLRDRVRRNAGRWLERVERGVGRDGAFYLLTLRLMPSVPFFLVNVLMALTPIRTRTYALVSWVGVLPITFLYAGVGTELAGLESPADVLSPPVLASLAALAVAPLVLRRLLRGRADPHPERGGVA
jgi:uncharacterized membrane protein YdjX (TVP38/TMEM64 family)